MFSFPFLNDNKIRSSLKASQCFQNSESSKEGQKGQSGPERTLCGVMGELKVYQSQHTGWKHLHGL